MAGIAEQRVVHGKIFWLEIAIEHGNRSCGSRTNERK